VLQVNAWQAQSIDQSSDNCREIVPLNIAFHCTR